MNISILGSMDVKEGEKWWKIAQGLTGKLAKEGHIIYHGGCGGTARAVAHAGHNQTFAIICDQLNPYMDRLSPDLNYSNIMQLKTEGIGLDVGLGIRLFMLTHAMDLNIFLKRDGPTTSDLFFAVLNKNVKIVVADQDLSKLLFKTGLDYSNVLFVDGNRTIDHVVEHILQAMKKFKLHL